jgi:predicted RNA-binding Zn ribbon-like protein
MKNEKSEIRDGFKFRAGHLALDLPATMAARLKPLPLEHLAHPSDLGRWLRAAGMTDAMPEVTQSDLSFARTLRESIYDLALARIHGEDLPDEARRRLNRIAAEASAIPQLAKNGRIHYLGKSRTFLVSLARDALVLFGGETSERIRQCEGETCALLFLDTSRSGDRRWCSMAGCGNKAKVADFRRRQRLNP